MKHLSNKHISVSKLISTLHHSSDSHENSHKGLLILYISELDASPIKMIKTALDKYWTHQETKYKFLKYEFSGVGSHTVKD